MRGATSEAEDTRQQKIEDLQNKIKWIKESLQGDTPIREIFASGSPKRDLLQKWAEYTEDLAKLGVYQKPINTISTYITDELRKMGLFETIPYVRASLPFKYKNPQLMRSSDEDLETRERLSPDSSYFHIENRAYSNRLRSTAEVLLDAADIIDRKEFISKLDKKTLKDLDEFYTRWDAAVKNLRSIIDGRNKVTVEKMHIFLYCASISTPGHAYAMFVQHIREFAKMTTKETKKIIEGKVKRMPLLYEPKDRLQAMDIGMTGFPCDWCGSWRNKAKYDTDATRLRSFCFACGKWSELKTERLPSKE